LFANQSDTRTHERKFIITMGALCMTSKTSFKLKENQTISLLLEIHYAFHELINK